MKPGTLAFKDRGRDHIGGKWQISRRDDKLLNEKNKYEKHKSVLVSSGGQVSHTIYQKKQA